MHLRLVTAQISGLWLPSLGLGTMNEALETQVHFT